MLEESEVRTIGKYEILGPLGRGTMGMVYKGRDPEIGRLVAIKTLRKLMPTALQSADAALERFRHEARSAGNLRHPHIVTIFEVGRDGDTPFIVMDYVEGTTLDQLLEREGRLSPDRVLHYLSQVAAALDYAHKKNVIHKDIKPANIFVDSSDQVFILDFGIAAITESFEGGAASAGPALGTPGYMSPEQILSERLDSRTDLFSLAIVAFECLTGQRPFPGKTFTEVIGNILNADPLPLTAVVRELPLALESEFERALSKKKNSRFPTAQDMIDAFANALGLANLDGRGFLRASSGGQWTTPQSRVSSSATARRDARIESGAFGDPNYGAATEGMGTASSGRVNSGLAVKHRRRVSVLQLFTFLAGASAVAVALGLFYVVYTPPKKQFGLAPEPIVATPAPKVERDPGSAPYSSQPVGKLINPQVERPPLGVSLKALTDKQLLGIIVDPQSPEGSIIEALREGSSRKVSNLVDASVQPLQNDSYLVRIEAIKTVARSGDRRIVPRLLQALDDHDPLVRGHAAKALGILGDQAVRSALIEREVAEEVPEVRAAMRSAAERLGANAAQDAAQ